MAHLSDILYHYEYASELQPQESAEVKSLHIHFIEDYTVQMAKNECVFLGVSLFYRSLQHG